jgi:CRP-like cAMP-binding protein
MLAQASDSRHLKARLFLRLRHKKGFPLVSSYSGKVNRPRLWLWGLPGDPFGLATIVRAPARYLVTVEAVQEGSLLAWDLPSCRALVLRCPSLSKAVNSVVANYLDGLIDALSARSFQTAEQRLARMLVVSARQLGRTGREGIELDLTNEQLAVTAHVSLFTATRKFSKWQDLGILKKHRGKIVLRSLSLFESVGKDTGR